MKGQRVCAITITARGGVTMGLINTMRLNRLHITGKKLLQKHGVKKRFKHKLSNCFWTFIKTLINNLSCTLCRTNQWHDLDQAGSAGVNLTHDDSGTEPAGELGGSRRSRVA